MVAETVGGLGNSRGCSIRGLCAACVQLTCGREKVNLVSFSDLIGRSQPREKSNYLVSLE